MDQKQKENIQSLPIVSVKGRHYDVGYCIGHTFAKRINDWFADPLSPIAFFRRFYADEEGRKVVTKYLETAEECFPEYVQEIRGIADGSEAAFEDVLSQNLLTELLFAHKDITERVGPFLSEEDQEVFGCTTVYVNRNGLRLIGHNEDGELGAEHYNFLAQVTVVDDNDPSIVKESFISFIYPGMIPGFALNVTSEFVITGNSLCPKSFCQTGVPIAFVVRKMLACKTVDEMVKNAKCEPYGCAYGFNLNIASVHGTDMWSLEILPDEKGTDVFLHEIPHAEDEDEKCHYFHQNFYKHVDTEELPCREGTLARGKRCEELPSPSDESDIKHILGDTKNEDFPIYRGDVDTDSTVKTVCTAVFNLTDKTLNLYLDNPKLNEPFATLVFPQKIPQKK